MVNLVLMVKAGSKDHLLSPHVHVPANILWSNIVSVLCFFDVNYVDIHVCLIKA
jgi:hypothetical protein